MNKKYLIILLLFVSASLYIFLSFLSYSPFEAPSGLSSEISRKNIMGIFGVYVSYYLMKFTFGWGAFCVPLVLAIYGYALFSRKIEKISKMFFINIIFFGIWFSISVALASVPLNCVS